MPRLTRKDVFYNGCYAHIISRSIRKLKLFRDEKDFQDLYRLIDIGKRRAGFKVFHYCFMQTHFHMAVQITDVDMFSNAIQYVKSRYCYRFHEKYRLSGPIWRERYRGLLIENESYLRACGEYIENNPVKAGIVHTAKDWKYSSSRYYQDGHNDRLVDSYKYSAETPVRITSEIKEEQFFEQGKVIGSPFYRFQFYEKFKEK